MKAEGLPPDWVNDMLASESKSFYTIKRVYLFLQYPTKTQTKIPGQDSFIILNNIRESKSVE
jgi:3-hydroxyacyl-CoA dehydrogenase